MLDPALKQALLDNNRETGGLSVSMNSGSMPFYPQNRPQLLVVSPLCLQF